MSLLIKKLKKGSVSPYREWYHGWIIRNARGRVLDVGKSTYWDYGFPTIDTNADLKPTITGDICQTDFPDDSFDVVLCNGMYECVTDPQRMVDECLRIGKKVIFGFVGRDYKPYKKDWKYYDHNINFKNIVETKDFNNEYHFIVCQK